MILWWARGGHGRVGKGCNRVSPAEPDHGADLRRWHLALLEISPRYGVFPSLRPRVSPT